MQKKEILIKLSKTFHFQKLRIKKENDQERIVSNTNFYGKSLKFHKTGTNQRLLHYQCNWVLKRYKSINGTGI
jgi:hypothetical protein